MYAIVGATGNTGRIVAEQLLERGEKVRAWVRSADKARELAARGAEVVEVDVEDGAAVREALAGVKRAYFLLPPNMATDDFLGTRAAIAENLAAGAKAAGLEHVVLLSSVGAQHEKGTGVIRTLHDFERRLRAAGVSFTALRAAYFAENWASVIPAVKGDAVLPQMLGDRARAIPMVGTADIANTAVAALLEGPESAGVIELEGSTRVSPNDLAAALSKRLGRTISVVDVPFEAQEATLTSFGIHPNVAALFREMYEGIDAGRVDIGTPGARHVKGTLSPIDVVLGFLG